MLVAPYSIPKINDKKKDIYNLPGNKIKINTVNKLFESSRFWHNHKEGLVWFGFMAHQPL